MIVPGRPHAVLGSFSLCLYDRRWTPGDDPRVLGTVHPGQRVLVLAAAEADPARPLPLAWALVLPCAGTPGWAMLPALDRP